MWRIAKSCCSQLWHLCEDSEALGGQFLSNKKASLKGSLSTESIFPAQLNFCLKHVIHILKAFHVEVHLRYLGPFLVHPRKHQNFAGKLHNRLLQHVRLCRNTNEVSSQKTLPLMIFLIQQECLVLVTISQKRDLIQSKHIFRVFLKIG